MRVRYFAWLRSRLNRAEEAVTPPRGVTTLNGLIDYLATLSPGHAAVFEDRSVIRAAINQVFADLDASFAPGDEIAFFPPVTGG